MGNRGNRLYRRLTTNRETYITTLAKLFDYATNVFPKNQALSFVDGSQKYTYGELRTKSIELMHLFSRYGINAGDRIALLSQNMPNWTVALFSIVSYGRVAVPILADSSESEVTNILNHSETKVIFISQRMLPKLAPEVKEKMTLVIDMDTLEIIHRDTTAFTCDGWGKDPSPEDLAMIIYTSGTSGKAKGVMLSHRNLCHNVIAAWHAQKASQKDKWLSILPMSHAYEMSFSVLYPFYVGGSVYHIKKLPTPTILMDAMKTVRPSIMCSVPLIIEKVYKASVVPTVERSRVLSWMKKRTPRILYWLIGKRIYKTFGGRMKFFGIGGSKLDPVVEDFLKKTKFPYAIGYGLTETAPLITNACVGKTKVGSIGVPAWKVEVKLQDINPETGDGEIIAKGDNVMLGYYKDPERTRKVITDDGWFRTNDLACMDSKGYFYIKGRLNNTILGPSGENIYPEEIEQVINHIGGVEESLVMERDGKLVALVKFEENVLNWNQATEDKFFENLQAKKKAVLDYVNKHVGKSSKVNTVEVVNKNFEKTATKKIRRFKYEGAHGDDTELEAQRNEENTNKSE